MASTTPAPSLCGGGPTRPPRLREAGSAARETAPARDARSAADGATPTRDRRRGRRPRAEPNTAGGRPAIASAPATPDAQVHRRHGCQGGEDGPATDVISGTSRAVRLWRERQSPVRGHAGDRHGREVQEVAVGAQVPGARCRSEDGERARRASSTEAVKAVRAPPASTPTRAPAGGEPWQAVGRAREGHHRQQTAAWRVPVRSRASRNCRPRRAPWTQPWPRFSATIGLPVSHCAGAVKTAMPSRCCRSTRRYPDTDRRTGPSRPREAVGHAVGCPRPRASRH